MRWIIIEDALLDRRGHWFEYVRTFVGELRNLGDQCSVLADRRVIPAIREAIAAEPVLPPSIWSRMSDGSGRLIRILRIPRHALATYLAIGRYLRSLPPSASNVAETPTVLFVPTVLVHHLLGWYLLWRLGGLRNHGTLLLFFPSLPLRSAENGRPVSGDGSPSFRLMIRLFAALRPAIESRAIILGVETEAMRLAGTSVFNVPYRYFPHPVPNLAQAPTTLRPSARPLTFACYGPARHEKGSDILVSAIDRHLEIYPDSTIQFVIQWMEDFVTPEGLTVRLPDRLEHHPRVEVIRRLFVDDEYERKLGLTDALLLPYRMTAYSLRVSRVVIEAMSHGRPVVATVGTTLAEQASNHGALVPCADGDVDSLLAAIRILEEDYAALSQKAQHRATDARTHFSVKGFRDRILSERSPLCQSE